VPGVHDEASWVLSDKLGTMTEEKLNLILQKLFSIEERLNKIEAADESEDQPTPIVTKRLVALVVFLLFVAVGTWLGLNYFFDHLLDVIPE
jgi:hypothetical protein